MRCISDLSGLVVADVRIQRRHEHQGLIEQLLDAGVVRLDTRDAVDVEGDGCIPEQLGALEEVGRHDGLKNVELEVALHACHRDRRVIPYDLGADHRHSLSLRGVDLTGHDGGAGLIGRDDDLTDTATRARGEEADIVGDLVKRDSHLLQGAVGLYDRVVGSQCLELVLSRHEGQAREVGDVACYHDIVALRRIEPRPYSRTTESELRQVRQRILDGLDAVLELCSVAAELLPQRQRCSVHEVRTTDLHHVGHLLSLSIESLVQLA